MSNPATTFPRPAERIGDRQPYLSPSPDGPIDLWLNSNEGLAPRAELIQPAQDRLGELIRRYPNAAKLEQQLADRFGLEREQVLVTAGADDALYRACQTMLDREREFILPMPTFEMLDRYGPLAGAKLIEIDWRSGPYPTDDVLGAITDVTSMIAVVSPNNPTGAVAKADDLRRLSAAARGALLVVDLAYAEYADEDLTGTALSLPNTLVVRTLSKAWGLAGLRVGYALGQAQVVRWLHAAGNPYAASGLSMALAGAWLQTGESAMRAHVARVRDERGALFELLAELGAEAQPSQANFVLARFRDAPSTWAGLAREGIAVRAFWEHAQLADCLRITCPGDAADYCRLEAALRRVMSGAKEAT